MAPRWLLAGIAAVVSVPTVLADPLVSKAGDKAAVPNWDIQSSSDIPKDLAKLSKPGADTSSWHHVPISKCTLMACLIETGLYDDQELFFSDNLDSFDWGQFTVPWVYRNEFALEPAEGRHFILKTNGIGSRADIYFNGELVADKDVQSGSYTGHEYDITDLVADDNALLIQAYPTDYFTDLALGFIDWNPAPPDNGTGVWRDVEIKQTGPVSLGPLQALVDIDPGHVTLRAMAKNLQDKPVNVTAKATISEPGNGTSYELDKTVSLGPGESKVIEFEKTFDDPQIWWPSQWGQQPLYSAKMVVSTGPSVSDSTKGNFGLREVTSVVNEDDDTVFSVNGYPFQVIGSGYTADMFLRFDPARFETIVKYMLDMGLNTIRLEGNNEHPELFEIADKYGLMVMAGWECCNKWESWEYNEELIIDPPDYWDDADYRDANATTWHEAQMLQMHPSMLAFVVGSDFWPDDRATKIYVDALRGAGFQPPIISSASKRGYPELLGSSGMKMDGPYDWVPPNYWFNTQPDEDRLGAAFGFGSELGPGVGTPEIGSLKRFLTDADMDDLWKEPKKGLYHMSTNVSVFYDRSIYNEGLYKRFGAPKSLEDYLLKAQVMDYEGTRAEFEGFSSLWSTGRIATGLIYWMLTNAWPSLHWNQFDYYLHPAGSYFGSKVGARIEHVAYNYEGKDLWLINHSIDRSGARSVAVEVIDLSGETISSETLDVETTPNTAGKIGAVSGLEGVKDVALLRLILQDGEGKSLSRNVYWVAPTVDELDWDNSTWYHTPVTKYADYTSLFEMDEATVKATAEPAEGGAYTIVLENESKVPAFFIRLNLVDQNGKDVNPVNWSDNYVTLWPKEKLQLRVSGGGAAVQIDGGNVAAAKLAL